MLRGYLESVRVLLQDPTSNLVAASMGVSIAVIFLIIIVLILLFFALSPGEARRGRSGQKLQRKKAVRPSPEQIARRLEQRRLARRVWWTTIAGGVLVAWIALFAGTSANLYCANTCHPMTGPADSWKQSAHRSVRCVRCHEGPAATSLFTGSASRVRSLYYSLASKEGSGLTLPSQRCLSCHESILTETIVSKRALAMSHAEPVAAGAVCTDCHGAQGHQQEVLTVGMPACLRCHDGVQASTECAVCHPKGIEATLQLTSEPIGNPVRLPDKPTCGGCHSEKACDDCHGLRMPHPVDYKEPQQHASPAAFEKKERVCFRCHTPVDCGECHENFIAHGQDWNERHQEYTRKDGDGYCLWCHKTKDFCSLCH